MRVAVVGPTGVLGRALIPLLLEQGHRVLALARSPEKAHALLPEQTEVIQADLLSLTSKEQLPGLLDGCEAVFHIATAIPEDTERPGAWDANTRLRTEGTQALLQAALKAGVRRYVQQSITMAYPDGGEEWIDEDTPLDSSHGRAHVCAPVILMEGLVASLAKGRMEWCILRGGSFVGPGTMQDRAIVSLRLGRLSIPGTGRNFVSLVHVADMAAACAATLAHAADGSVFNIVSEPLRQAEYLEQLAASTGVSAPKRDESLPTPPSWRCSNRRARESLRWKPGHSVIP